MFRGAWRPDIVAGCDMPAVTSASRRDVRAFRRATRLRTVRSQAASGRFEVACGTTPTVDWSAFDLVVIRSTWDYTTKVDAFLDWVARGAAPAQRRRRRRAGTTTRRYLRALHAAGVPTVPTRWDPDDAAARSMGREADDLRRRRRHDRRRRATTRSPRSRGSDGPGEAAMVQPYLDGIDERGGDGAASTSAASYSHAVRKAAVLGHLDEATARTSPIGRAADADRRRARAGRARARHDPVRPRVAALRPGRPRPRRRRRPGAARARADRARPVPRPRRRVRGLGALRPGSVCAVNRLEGPAPHRQRRARVVRSADASTAASSRAHRRSGARRRGDGGRHRGRDDPRQGPPRRRRARRPRVRRLDVRRRRGRRPAVSPHRALRPSRRDGVGLRRSAASAPRCASSPPRSSCSRSCSSACSCSAPATPPTCSPATPPPTSRRPSSGPA